jgi:RNA polymerase sigma-70 factor, ECF subfamily
MGLASAFLSSWGKDPSNVSMEALEAELVSLHDRCRAAHPGVKVPAEAFAAFVGEKVRDDPDPLEGAARLAIEDLYLAFGCARGDPTAARSLESAHRGRIERALRRLRLADRDLPDLIQKLYQRILVPADEGPPRIAQYEGRAPLATWIRVVATRLALNERRGAPPEPPAEDELVAALVSPEDDLELAYMKERYRQAFRSAFRSALATLSRRDRTLLGYMVLDGLALEEIGRLHRVHRTTASRWLQRAQARLLAATRTALAANLGVEREEADSILRLLGSRLEASFSALALSRPTL